MGKDYIKENNYEFNLNESVNFVKKVDEFCESLVVEKNASKHTIRNYKNDLVYFAIWSDREQANPFCVNYKLLRTYLAEMSGAQYSRSTINRRLSALRSFYKWLDVTGQVNNNFTDVMSGPKILKTLPHIIRHSDMEKLIDVCVKCISEEDNKIKRAASIRDYSIIELMYATGARISELSSLEIENIDFEMSQVKFFGKGNKERIVPIYQKASNALHDYISNARHILLGENATSEVAKYCFISNTSKVMSADTIRKMFKKKCRLANISDDISPHAMRHTFATDVLDGGADLRSVQEMLGHSSLSTTQIYTHLSAKKLKDVHNQAHPRS